MKNRYLRVTALFLLVLTFAACSQDPIFYTISKEVAPKDPRIPGGPVNFAVFQRNNAALLYAASGNKLHWYQDSKWDNDLPDTCAILQPGGWIIQIAAAEKHLFAITIPDSAGLGAGRLMCIGQTQNEWKKLDFASAADSNPSVLFSLFAPPKQGYIFIGGEQNSGTDKFSILYADSALDSPTINTLISSSTAALSGAAFDGTNYYLCTGGGVVYVFDSLQPGTTPSSYSISGKFVGIISLDDGVPATIIAIERGGTLYTVNSGGIAKALLPDGKEVTIGGYASGALALWEDPNGSGEKLLLAGRLESLSANYTYGYREFRITGSGSPLEAAKEPGVGSFTSTDNNERYRSTIGKHPVNYMIQTPKEVDAKMTLFASTQGNGVWSYKDRDGTLQWNAEE